MSEYTGGPLDALASLFMEALRADKPADKKRLIDEWNEAIKRCNSVLMTKIEGNVRDGNCMIKSGINPVTGCAHIRNERIPCGGMVVIRRVCSACGAGIMDHHSCGCIDEEDIEYCWNCGATFDHTDDEQKEEQECE